jgi:predicted MPP superfamily phosphohydrolase
MPRIKKTESETKVCNVSNLHNLNFFEAKKKTDLVRSIKNILDDYKEIVADYEKKITFNQEVITCVPDLGES